MAMLSHPFLPEHTVGLVGQRGFLDVCTTFAATVATSAVVKDTFFVNALREFIVGLCRGNGTLYHYALDEVAHASGIAFQAGYIVPTSKHSPTM